MYLTGKQRVLPDDVCCIAAKVKRALKIVLVAIAHRNIFVICFHSTHKIFPFFMCRTECNPMNDERLSKGVRHFHC